MSNYLIGRCFIGGSDARVIMGDDEANLVRLWRENGARSSRRTSRTIWSSSSAPSPRTSTGTGMSATPVAIKDVQRRVQHPVHVDGGDP